MVTSNVDPIIASGIPEMPGTVAHMLAELKGARGMSAPSDLAGVWEDMAADARVCRVMRTPLSTESRTASYELLEEIELACGEVVSARLIMPREKPDAGVPLILMFNDCGRASRGWHHMTRFVALGAAVLALDIACPSADALFERPGEYYPLAEGDAAPPDQLRIAPLARAALALVNVALTLPGVNTSRIHAWGEGLGGGLALMAAQAAPAANGLAFASLAMANPLPASVCAEERGSASGYFNLEALAPRVTCPVLVGTGLMDEVASVSGQFAVVNALSGDVRHVVYPKHGHERINEFENEHLKFLHQVL